MLMKTMFAITLAATAAVAAAGAHAQPAGSNVSIQPSVDTPEQRVKLRTFTSCLADQRTKWARRTLAAPYLSDEQATSAAQALEGRDTCVRGDEEAMTFRTSTLVGALAEHFLRAELSRADFQDVADTLARVEPLNVSEDFAFCVASRDPVAARALALSEPGSDAEVAAAQRFQRHLPVCMKPGEPLTVDLQALRALMATALYRAVTAAPNSRS